MPSFSIALSGLEANSVALNTIGNNLANLNTTAFKEQTTSFADLFYQTVGTSGANNALQVGLGTRVDGTTTDFSNGSLLPTTNSTDMALNGNGFFVEQQGGVQSLTRAGDFQLDLNGNLISDSGQSVMGYAAENGAVNTNSPLVPLSIPVNATQAAQATQNFGITANLNAGASVGDSFTSSLSVYDSLGTSHTASIAFTKTATNTWSYSIGLPAGDATGTPVNNTGTLTFDSSGNLLTPTGNVTGITFPGLTDGAADLNMTFDLTNSSGQAQIGQSVAASAATASSQDGYASGAYQSFTVDASGTISASFNNGQKELIGQVAVATVTNLQGLARVGSNNYQTTVSSGAATIGTAGAGGRASVEDDTLEQSNVDISTEFSNLIVAQRAFEANSKTVTTFDTVTQETINMIR